MFNYKRTLKVDILTLFLSLNIISILFILSLSYVETHRAIITFSKHAISRVGLTFSDRVKVIGIYTQESVNLISNSLVQHKNFSIKDPAIEKIMLEALKFNHNASAFFFADPSGNLIIVANAILNEQTHLVGTPETKVPLGTAYVIGIIDASENHREFWYYKDKDDRILSSEVFSHATINALSRPWYIGAMHSKDFYWTDIYSFSTLGSLGISVAKPVVNNQGKTIGVVGADLSSISFTVISNLLTSWGGESQEQASAFILNSDGTILIPQRQQLKKLTMTQSTLSIAYKEYQRTHQNVFFIKDHGKRFLIFLANSPAVFGNHWMLSIAGPFTIYFYKLIHAQVLVAGMTLIILFISVLIIISFSKRLSSPIVTLAREIHKIRRLNFRSERRVHSYIKEIDLIDTAIASMRNALRSFIRYVPKEIVKQLLLQGKDIALEGEKKEVTIMFTDIKDFTTISENYPAEELMGFLAEYFDGISKIILSHKGTIDKYIGDSVMAFWGAPMELEDHAIFACKAALYCRNFSLNFNQKQLAEGKPEFVTRFGINTGIVMVGNIGTLERMNYTLIGDAVNVASRLENTDKIYHVMIMISEEVKKRIGHKFLLRPLDKITIRGKEEKINVYELVAAMGKDLEITATSEQIQLCREFTQAYQTLVIKNYLKAKTLFENIHQKFPTDYPTTLYLHRIEELLKHK